MKVKKKILLITLISALVLTSVYTYIAKGVITVGETSGYLILMDQKITSDDYAFLRNKTFSSIIYLPSENCEGTINYCSYGYKEGINSNADINNDGKIDLTDFYIVKKALPCGSTQSCWNQPIEDCFFTIQGRKFKDPTRDCVMNQTDLDLVTDNLPAINSDPLSTNCDSIDVCKADVNKDGVVDVIDYAIVRYKFGQYADYFERYVEHKSQADVNKDGVVDALDYQLVKINIGEESVEQRCVSNPIIHISGKKYFVSASGPGLYYAGASYRCTL